MSDSVDIVIGIPRYTAGVGFYKFDQLVLQIQLAAHKSGFTSVVYQSAGPDLPRNRNLCVKHAQEREAKWLFFIDSDTFPPVDVLAKLIAHGKDIVSGTYFGKMSPFVPIASMEDGNAMFKNIFLKQEQLGELIEVGGCGGGCLLINMDVFKKLPKPYFAMGSYSLVRDYRKLYEAALRAEGSKDMGTLRRALADIKKPMNDREQNGEDYWFCMAARDAGFKVYLDTAIQCGHMGWYQYSFKDHLAAQEAQ